MSIGYSFLVARAAPDEMGALALEAGAFLDLVNGELYCIGSISGSLEEGAIGEVTFSNFRRALPCEDGSGESSVEACFERDQSPEEP